MLIGINTPDSLCVVKHIKGCDNSNIFDSKNIENELQKKIEISRNFSVEQRKKNIKIIENDNPERIEVVSIVFKRSSDVIVEVLNRANGFCELCSQKAPFLRAKDGSPYLEVHHKNPLSEGGKDNVINAIALCPNCHRKVHYGVKNT